MHGLTKKLLTVAACLGLLGLISAQAWGQNCFPLISERVIIPYAQHGSGWYTGLAITNLNTVNATEAVSVLFYETDGDFMESVNIGSLDPGQQYVATAQAILGEAPSTERFWMIVTHTGEEEIAVTEFVWNDGNGFGFQSYNSQTYESTICLPDIFIPPHWELLFPAMPSM